MVRDNHKAMLLGIGLDNDDGKTRVTRAENFHLVGGSDDTHQSMQEKCMKLNEKLDAKGKTLEQLERQEFLDMAAECEINLQHPRKSDD